MYNELQGGYLMLNVLICDDNPEIVNQVNFLLNNVKKKQKINFTIDAKTNGDFAIKSKSMYDIAIIDIEMPGINGLKLTELLKKHNPDIIVIILTSFSDYLDSAMKISVFRYLSKPIDKNRFYRNFTEALDYYNNISKQIFVEKEDYVYTVKTKDILYIENTKHGSKIVTKHGIYKTSKKPQDWANEINLPNCFVFSHKSFLVNLQNVINFNKSTITFQHLDSLLEVVCVSQRRYYDFKKAFYNFVGGK